MFPPAIETGTLALTAFWLLAATPKAPWFVVAFWAPIWAPPGPPEPLANAEGATQRATSATATLSSLNFIRLFSPSRVVVSDQRAVADTTRVCRPEKERQPGFQEGMTVCLGFRKAGSGRARGRNRNPKRLRVAASATSSSGAAWPWPPAGPDEVMSGRSGS